MKKIIKIIVVIILLAVLFFIFNFFFIFGNSPYDMPDNFKVAILGDQSLSRDAHKVLGLIKSENAEALIHLGDYDYVDNPRAWNSLFDLILGPKFPVFAVIGNHDENKWGEYQKILEERLKKVSDIRCTGEVGINLACHYKGLFFINSGVGTKGEGHLSFIEKQLESTNSIWRICAWHKNNDQFQVENKAPEVGTEYYDACKDGGAFIATGHAHQYARTHLMDSFKEKKVASKEKQLKIEKGKSFAVVSGLGGKSIRDQNDSLASNPWWASIYTSRQNAKAGALFCVFNVDGILEKGQCYFKNINGEVVDRFDLLSDL